MTTGELIRILSKYPDDTKLYVTSGEMHDEDAVRVKVADYDEYGDTLDIEIYAPDSDIDIY